MVFQAGLIAFLRTILIFVGIYYGLRLLMRFLFPWLVKTFLKKQFSNYSNSQSSNSSNYNTSSKSGSKQKSEKKDKLGEYIDYEEIKDNE